MGVGDTNHFLKTGGTHARNKEGDQEEGRCKEGRQESDQKGDSKKSSKEKEEVTSRTLLGARRPRRAFFLPASFFSFDALGQSRRIQLKKTRDLSTLLL
jgi:hypothetical protein